MKILFVDDEPSIREIFYLTFSKTHELMMAKDGEEALSLAQENYFDLIITDVSLPKLSGVDFIKTLRKERNHTPFIIITGDSNIELAINTFRMGAIDFFLKPFKMTALGNVIDRFESMHINKTETIQSKDLTQISENIEFELLPKIRRVNYYVNFLTSKFSSFPNLKEEDSLALKVILYELISNAIEHGTAGINYLTKKTILENNQDYFSIVEEKCKDSTKKIYVSIDYKPSRLKITVRDEGEGFDPNKVPDPIQNPSLNLYSGRGLFLTKLNIDSIEFNEKGNSVTVTRILTNHSSNETAG